MKAPVEYEPTMEEILASIRRIIAEECEVADVDIAHAVLRNARPPLFTLSSGAVVIHRWGRA